MSETKHIKANEIERRWQGVYVSVGCSTFYVAVATGHWWLAGLTVGGFMFFSSIVYKPGINYRKSGGYAGLDYGGLAFFVSPFVWLAIIVFCIGGNQ